jgi:hypothetical protein
LTTELTQIKYPRHFLSVQELTTWLAQDDTNTNPKYAAYNLAQKSYLLQIKQPTTASSFR